MSCQRRHLYKRRWALLKHISMALVVRIRSAHDASKVWAIQSLACSSIFNLKLAICNGPLHLFSSASSIALILHGSILFDEILLSSLNILDNSCITAVRVCAAPLQGPRPTASAIPLHVPTAISRGVGVCIHSLIQRPDLNGRSGVVYCLSDDQTRWLVNIDSDRLATEQAWLRPCNMTALSSNQRQLSAESSDAVAFVPLGIPFECILEFIQRHGGESAFEGLTTSQVKRRFIMPETLHSKLSLCEQLRAAGDTRVADAQIFVSHAWQYKFMDVVRALQSFLAAEADGAGARLWLDAFSTSQHETYCRPPLWWQRTFVNAIGRMGRLVMVLTPWVNPIALSRAWCILELFACINSRSTFNVALPPDQYSSIFDAGLNENFIVMLSKVQCETSECSREEDRLRIFDTVRAAVGFSAMDRLVFQSLSDWLLKQLNAEKMLRLGAGDLPRSLQMSRNLALLLNTLGRPFDAEKELQEAMRLIKAPQMNSSFQKSAQQHPSEFFLLMSDFGLTCLKQGRNDEATEIYDELFKMTGDHLFLMNLAMAHRASQRFVEAERLYNQCLQTRIQLLGPEHQQTIVCMNSLAVTYRELKQFHLAEPLFLQVIEIGKRTLGEHHTNTEAAVLGLANCYRDQRLFAEAEKLYIKLLKSARRTKGFLHPETLDVLANLANVNGDLGFWEKDINRYKSAEKMYTEAIQLGIETIGAQHPLVVRWQSNFAIDMQAKKMLFG